MGTFMATGIVTKIESKEYEFEILDKSRDEIENIIKKEIEIDFSLYEKDEKSEDIVFNIKDTILKEHLYPFLNRFYPDFYNRNERLYGNVLNRLKDLNTNEILEYANTKSEYVFQTDIFADYIRSGFGKSLVVYNHIILLSIEGKVLAEEYGKHFDFFERCVKEVYKDYPIVKSFKIYITQ